MQRKRHTAMRDLLEAILSTLLGHRYYAVVVGEAGSGYRYDLASTIHATRRSAEAHRHRIEQTHKFVYIETISFRSHHDYTTQPSQP